MARKLLVEILGDASSLERAFKKSGDGAQKFNRDVSKASTHEKVFGGLGKAAALAGGALGIGGFAEAAKASFEEMQDSAKVAAQTGAVLKSTGGAANVSAKQVDDLSTSLMNKSGVDDEVVKSGENMLLTFTNVRNEAGKGNDIFNQATGTMMDMSTALGEDAPKAAMQLGKALNDPVKGVTALRRVGVQFTDDQKNQIEAMVKSGNTMGAQKMILRELNKEFGGSAKAAGETLPGKLSILKNNLLNLGGEIAGQLTPAITGVVTKIVDWISKSQNQKKIMDVVHQAVGALKTGINILKGAWQILTGVVGGNRNAIKLLIGLLAAWKIASMGSKVAGFANNFIKLGRDINGARRGIINLIGKLTGKGGLVGEAAQAESGVSDLAGGLGGAKKGALKGAAKEGEAAAASLGTQLAGEGGLAAEAGAAETGIAGLATALGPAVLVAGALAAGYALGNLLYQIPLVRDAANEAAVAIANLFGTDTNPYKQYQGKKIPGKSRATFDAMRAYASTMEARGVTSSDTAKALALKFPGYATRDYETIAGVHSRTGYATYSPVHITFNGVTDTNEIQRRINDTIARHYRRTPASRR